MLHGERTLHDGNVAGRVGAFRLCKYWRDCRTNKPGAGNKANLAQKEAAGSAVFVRVFGHDGFLENERAANPARQPLKATISILPHRAFVKFRLIMETMLPGYPTHSVSFARYRAGEPAARILARRPDHSMMAA